MFCGTCNVGLLLLEWWEDMSGKRLFYLFCVVCCTGYGDSVTGLVLSFLWRPHFLPKTQNLSDTEFVL